MSGPKISVDPDAVAAGVKRLWRAMDGNGGNTDLAQMASSISRFEGGSDTGAMSQFVAMLRSDLQNRSSDAQVFNNNVNLNIQNLQAAVTDLMNTDSAAGQVGQQLLGHIGEATGAPVGTGGAAGGAVLTPAPAAEGGSAQPATGGSKQDTTRDEYA
jgi:hypothetical protein